MKKILVFVFPFLTIAACKDPYDPGISYPSTGYLVMEGFVNSGAGATDIRLSRTVKTSDSARLSYEANADMLVEGDDGSVYVIPWQTEGRYYTENLHLNDAHQYRLRIRTADGREYLSDYNKVIRTPPIDSISYYRTADGVHINLNTHDPGNNTQYYTWQTDETWEIQSRYLPNVTYRYDSQLRPIGIEYIFPDGRYDYSGYTCWRTEASTKILLGSTIKLDEDKLTREIAFIEEGSWKLDVKYSIHVVMHGRTPEGFDFLQRMAKNSEQVGTIFDAQPSELNSNLHSTTNPDEPVIGFVEFADRQEQRIFIRKTDVAPWVYEPECEDKEIPIIPKELMDAYIQSYVPIVFTSPFNTSVQVASQSCTDCRMRGTNIMPPFWQ